MHKLRSQAEKLREQGYSYNLIHQKLGIPKSTMSYWFQNKPFTPNDEVLERVRSGSGKEGLRRHEKRLKEVALLKQQGAYEIGNLSDRDLWILGLGIYIGEGAKTTEMIRISNADPAVIRLAVRWLKDACKLKDENLSVRIHIYPDNNPDDCLSYWQEVTNLHESCFRKVSVDLRTDKSLSKKRRLPYGTAHITVVSRGDPEKGVRLFRRINGWMTGALNQV
jgi:hypothetical protein